MERQKKVFINGKFFMVNDKKELDVLKMNIEKSNEKVVGYTSDNKKKIQIHTDNVFNVKRATGRPIPIKRMPPKKGEEVMEEPKVNFKENVTASANKPNKIVATTNAPQSQIKKITRDGVKLSKPVVKNMTKPKHDAYLDDEQEDSRKFNIKRAANVRPIDPKKQLIVQKRDEYNKLKKAEQDKIEEEVEEEVIEDHVDMSKYLDSDDYYEHKFDLHPNKWYTLVVKLKEPSKEGLLKILDAKKQNIFPLVKLPNVIHSTQKKVTIEELHKVNDYRLYFKAGAKVKTAYVFALGMTFSYIKLQETPLEIVKKSIDLWKLRKHYDLELTNYYLTNFPIDKADRENQNHKKFMDKFKADYDLYKNPNYFDKINFEVNLPESKVITSDYPVNVLYLTYSSIEYESYGYTIRTHYLLQNTTSKDYKMYGCTMYGYPYNREPAYYSNKKPVDSKIIDDILYVKILNGTDNIYTNNLVDFLGKYITGVIELAHRLNVKVIHAASNFWNGIAAVYAAKHLGIKSVYEIRGFWDEATIAMRPELKNSDYLRMMINLEMKVFNDTDKIITINTPLKDRLIDYKIDPRKIEILYNGVDTERYKFDKNVREKLRKELGIKDTEIVIGYIGTISDYEGIEYILECLKLLNTQHSVRFVMIGDGIYKDTILTMIKDMKISNRVVYMSKMPAHEVIKYYNVFDMVAYPRKDNCLCQSTSSYKVFEAMSMGLPIIVSELDAWKEIIKDNETGLYYEPDNEQNLLGKLIKLIEDPELRQRLGENARKWVMENREWKHMGRLMRGIYERVLNPEKIEEDCGNEDMMCQGCREEECREKEECSKKQVESKVEEVKTETQCEMEEETMEEDNKCTNDDSGKNVEEIKKVKKNVSFSDGTKKESVDDETSAKIKEMHEQPIIKAYENDIPMPDPEDNIEIIDNHEMLEEEEPEDNLEDEDEETELKKWKEGFDRVVESINDKNNKNKSSSPSLSVRC